MSTVTQKHGNYTMSADEASKSTGFSVSAFYHWAQNGMLSFAVDKGRYLFAEDEVMSLVASRTTRKKFATHPPVSSP